MSNSSGIFDRNTLVSFLFNLSVFIIVWKVLSSSLFSTFSKVFQKREELIEGQKKKAEELHREADRVVLEFESRISTEKISIKKQVESLLQQAEASSRAIIQSAREEAARELENTRKKIMEEANRIRENLRKEVPSIALKMASRVVGRDLSL